MDKNFNFGRKDFINSYLIDESLMGFRKLVNEESSRLELTIREIIQNSLDARLYEDQPAIVNLEYKTISPTVLPGLDQIFDILEHLDPQNEYMTKTVSEMKQLKNLNMVNTLIAEDINTRALQGAKSKDPRSIYYSYAYSKGKHNELESA